MKQYRNIRNIRKKKKIRAEDLAKKLKISLSTYHRKERLIIPFIDSELVILSEILNTSINKLLVIIDEDKEEK